MRISYRIHRNCCGTVGKIITSCFSPPFQHCSLDAEESVCFFLFTII